MQVVLHKVAPENKAIPKPIAHTARNKAKDVKNDAKKDSKVDPVADSSLSKIPRPISKPVRPEVPSFSSVVIPDNVENIDENDNSNVFLTTDYVNDIYDYLRHLEVSPNIILF